MAFFEFPNARTFDSDLTWVIEKIKELLKNMGSLNEAWEAFKEQYEDLLSDTIKETIQNMIDDGSFATLIDEWIDNIPFINVKDNGAKGDGVTDDTEAIQNCINNFVGNIIFFPKGVYIISAPIKLPNDTIIQGCCENSIIRCSLNFSGISMLMSEHFEELTGNEDPTNSDQNWTISDISLDGYYRDMYESTFLRPKAEENGLSLYGYGYHIRNVNIYNVGGSGFWLEYSSRNYAFDLENYGPGYIVQSRIWCCGKNGMIVTGATDFIIDGCNIHTNSKKGNGLYDNLQFVKGGAKIANTHLFCLYGTVKPRYSLNISVNAGSVILTNCHIEGAMELMLLHGNNNVFSNTRFYNTFGACSVRCYSSYNRFVGCDFWPQATDIVSPDRPEYTGAFIFDTGDSGAKNNCIVLSNCMLERTNLTADPTNIGLYCKFDFTGNSTTPIGELKTAKMSYGGYFNTTSIRDVSGYGFPDAATIGVFSMKSDVTINSRYNTVNSYISGTLKMNLPTHGALYIILNPTSSEVPIQGNSGVYINGSASATNIPPKSITFLMAQTTTNYHMVSVG